MEEALLLGDEPLRWYAVEAAAKELQGARLLRAA